LPISLCWRPRLLSAGINSFHRWYCRSSRWGRRVEESLLPWALRDADLGEDVLEVGPGPGRTTAVLQRRARRLTAIELDPDLADRLRRRMDGGNVTVVEGDATAMPFEDGRFSAAVCFTMLHHVPSAELQDRLLAEVRRVLRPGGMFYGSDSTVSPVFRLAHVLDTMVVVDPAGFGQRLAAAGFVDPAVSTAKGAFRFKARRP
jgi:SAM-dependent methyltransferase